MRVFITGATAPLGRALVDSLLAAPDVELIMAVGRQGEPSPGFDARVVYRAVDLTRPRALHDLVWGEAQDLGIDAVVHGMQHRRIDRGAAIHKQNVDATRELVLACLDHPTIRRFIYRSFAEVYSHRRTTSDLLDEDSPLDFDPSSQQWVRDRVEADLTVCTHFASKLRIAVLRCAEILAADTGSQLWDYLQSRVCLRPLGFDPMLNVMSLPDAVAATNLALRSTAIGPFNIPGFDTLPLSCAIAESGRGDIPVPGPLMAPLYGLRRWIAGFEFRYDMNLQRFHFGGVLDGGRATRMLGYLPRTPVTWPRSWWHALLERLATGDDLARASTARSR